MPSPLLGLLSKQVIVSKPQRGERRYVIYDMRAMQTI